ncbi:SMI1/KNR4 family protein [Dactylosporangium sp. McL0621]|uniref:SMI1/KNR4 family protein n=1 Tax=Dactylosporangium sp. McL0621 TaxID=3415678 RepID=UPI003CF5A73A
MESVDASADRIFGWLREHAPGTAATLKPPAGPDALDAAEREVGAAFPHDVRRWYGRADGMEWTYPWRGALIPSFHRPYPLAMALDIRNMMLEVAAQFPQERPPSAVAGEPSAIWQPSFLPIAADTGGVKLLVDLRDGEQRGCVMEYDKVFACQGRASWPGVAAMLADVAGALVHDRVAGGYRPQVDEQGCLYWRYPEGLWLGRDAGLYTPGLARDLAELAGHAAATDHADPDRAALITARAARVVDALVAAGENATAGRPARYDDPDPNDEAALRVYLTGHGGLAGVARHLADAGERLVALCAPFHEEHGAPHRPGRPPLLPATVRERGDIVFDGVMSWPDLVAGLGWLLRSAIRGISELRPAEARQPHRSRPRRR